jgi:hypothetical protein
MILNNPFVDFKIKYNLELNKSHWDLMFLSNNYIQTNDSNDIVTIWYRPNYPKVIIKNNLIEIIPHYRLFNLNEDIEFFKAYNTILFDYFRKKQTTANNNIDLSSYNSNYIYFIGDDYSHYVKIGKTTNIKKRLSVLQTASPYTLKVLFLIEDKYSTLEGHFHDRYERYRLKGEWFDKYILDDIYKNYNDKIIKF